MKKIGVLCFSPTGTTKTVCRTIAENIPGTETVMLDMTLPVNRARLMSSQADEMKNIDHFVIGVPVYGGKVPAFARAILENIRVRGKTATSVVVYGNRDYGAAPRLLYKLLTKQGFSVTSAGIYAAENPYAIDPPAAAGRPDKEDLQKAAEFGKSLRLDGKVLNIKDIPDEADMLSMLKSEMSIAPFHDESTCLRCGICSSHCPAGIIDGNTGQTMFSSDTKCLGCLACVKACPNNARIFKVNAMQKMMGRIMLSKAARIRREPVTVH